MTKLDEFLAKEGGFNLLHSTMPLSAGMKEKLNVAAGKNLPQWVKDLKQDQDKSLFKDFIDGRLTALSVGEKEVLDAVAKKYGFEYETPKSGLLFNAMDKSYDR